MSSVGALETARTKARWRLLPLLCFCYVIAYVDRTNVGIAALTMTRDLPGFDNEVMGYGMGMFFIGYFLLEIPGTLIVEKWSARKWICRIMVTWGIMAALTAMVKTPFQFYVVRFLLGLAEAGFFPGVIVYMTHWIPVKDRARALAVFMMAGPVAQIISPKLSSGLLRIGTTETINGVPVQYPEFLGLEGWQWVYIVWGIPAVVLGIVVWFGLTDRPRQAKWLSTEERDALEAELQREKELVRTTGNRLTVLQALRHPKVLLLALTYFCVVTGGYGVQFFMPSILYDWYSLNFSSLTTLLILPPLLGMAGQLVASWSSDRMQERRWHAVLPIAMGALALGALPWTKGNLLLTIVAFMLAYAGFKAYLPVFWTLPGLLLTEAAAAGSIGLINSIGNLGGFVGPSILGKVETVTGSFVGGIYCLSVSMMVSASILYCVGLGRRKTG